MSLESKSKYHIIEIVDPPPRPFLCPFPSKGMVYDYRFIKEVNSKRIMYMPFIKGTKLKFSFQFDADYQTKSKMSSNCDINLISVSMALN